MALATAIIPQNTLTVKLNPAIALLPMYKLIHPLHKFNTDSIAFVISIIINTT